MAAHETVLCLQDGTDFNFSRLVQSEGPGVIGSNQTDAKCSGRDMHSTFVVSTEGLPLGVLAAQCTAPLPKAKDGSNPAKVVPIEEKKNILLDSRYARVRQTCSRVVQYATSVRVGSRGRFL